MLRFILKQHVCDSCLNTCTCTYFCGSCLNTCTYFCGSCIFKSSKHIISGWWSTHCLTTASRFLTARRGDSFPGGLGGFHNCCQGGWSLGGCGCLATGERLNQYIYKNMYTALYSSLPLLVEGTSVENLLSGPFQYSLEKDMNSTLSLSTTMENNTCSP